MPIDQDQKTAVRQVTEQLYAAIAISGSGDNIVVAAVSGFYIRLIRYELFTAAAVNVTWKSSVAGALSGVYAFPANGGICTAECPAGITQTAISESLVINLGGGVVVGGMLTYVLVKTYPGTPGR